jgi:hypothetical protein
MQSACLKGAMIGLMHCSKRRVWVSLFDHLVGAAGQRWPQLMTRAM